jgi:dTDP-4-dehydrorhamnose reductase
LKNILITGGTGLFGLNFYKQFYQRYNIFLIGNKKRNIPNTQIYYIDLFNVNKINNFCIKKKIDTIIHAAAITNIEDCQKNKKKCFKTNVSLTKLLSKFCNLNKIKFIFISTDQIFNKNISFKSELMKSNPCNYYGYSKNIAEKETLKNNRDSMVIRTNFFGHGTKYRKSFSDWIILNLKKKNKINVFDDIYFNPMYLKSLNFYLVNLIKLKSKGIFNLVSDEKLSKYEFAIKIASVFKLDSRLIIKSKFLLNKKLVERPRDMTLSNNKLKKKLKLKSINMQKQIKNMLKDSRYII